MTIRSPSERKTSAIHRLEHDANIWIATASEDGVPHLIPLSLAWDGSHVLVATPTDSPTVRNALASGRVKASLDSADDVVMIDGFVEVIDHASADRELARLHAARVGWDIPTDGDWSYLVIEPRTIRAWNSLAEITGRTIMRDGAWTS